MPFPAGRFKASLRPKELEKRPLDFRCSLFILLTPQFWVQGKGKQKGGGEGCPVVAWQAVAVVTKHRPQMALATKAKPRA